MPTNPDVVEYMDGGDPLARTEAPRSRGGKGCTVPDVDSGDGECLTLRGLVLQVPFVSSVVLANLACRRRPK